MSCRSRFVGVIGIGFVLAACQDPTPVGVVAQPVVGAELSTDDPGVVALLIGQNVFCTGTLVSPRVVLTAGHCVDAGAAGATAFFGDYTEATGLSVPVVGSMAHPMWNGELSNGHDIGVVLLGSAQDPALVVPMNTTDLSTMIGADYRVVGFGIHDRDTGELDGYKRTAVMKIDNVSGDYVEIVDVDPTTDPDTAICQGDSGGPGFVTIGGVELLAGVHSYSIQGCFNPSGDSRVEVFLPTFIQAWIDANDPTCGEDGLCAPVGCTNDPDCMPCGADGTCAASCELPDVDCPTQDIGEICRGNTQCMSGQCVYWDEDPRVKFCSQPCGDGCPTGMTCESVQPFGPICYYADTAPPGALGAACTTATDCAEYICENNVCTYECSVPEGRFCQAGFMCQDLGMGARCYGVPVEDDEGGGCSTTGGDPAGWVLLGIGLLVLRRRRA
jgi:MYXO-CTERM domain-containing protein